MPVGQVTTAFKPSANLGFEAFYHFEDGKRGRPRRELTSLLPTLRILVASEYWSAPPPLGRHFSGGTTSFPATAAVAATLV